LGIEASGAMNTMTTDIKKHDTKPGTMPPNPSKPPSSVTSKDKKTDKVDQVADRLAHNTTKTEKNYDAEHGKEFVK
jgi:hypothetical protein